MKFYINNNELSEKVFWRTLDSLVSPIQRVHIFVLFCYIHLLFMICL